MHRDDIDMPICQFCRSLCGKMSVPHRYADVRLKNSKTHIMASAAVFARHHSDRFTDRHRDGVG